MKLAIRGIELDGIGFIQIRKIEFFKRDDVGQLIKVLWRHAGKLFLVVVISYILIFFLLPVPKEPEPISLNGSKFERVLEPFDGQFVAVYITKNLSDKGSIKYLKEWENLNPGFDRRDLTEIVGFDKRRNSISYIRCLILIDCRNGEYHRSQEQHFNEKGKIIHYISSEVEIDTGIKISKGSTIDELAMSFCEKSAY